MGPKQVPKPNTANTKYRSVTSSMWWNLSALVTTFCLPCQPSTCRLSLGLVLFLSRSIRKGFTRCLWLSSPTSHGLASLASGYPQFFLGLHFRSFVPWPLGASLHGIWPCLASVAFWKLGVSPPWFPELLQFLLPVEPGLCGWHCQFWLRARDTVCDPVHQIWSGLRHLGS